MADELSWRDLAEKLPTMTEKHVLKLLEDERRRRPAPRVTILTRLHQRYTALRATRERKELIG